METLDWVMIGGYFTLLLGVAWWVVYKSKDTAADYFLAGRNLSWWIVGASIFASNIGSEHVVGLAGSGAKDGVAMAHYELHAWCLLMLGWVFVPFYARSMVFTMPEFLEKRFSTGSRYVLSIVSLITFVVSKIAVGIFAGGIVFSTLLPEMRMPLGNGQEIDSFWIGSVLVILLTGLYTILGGMRAVAYNDAIQTIVLIIGSATLTIYGLAKLGHGSLVEGWAQLRAICPSDMLNLWKPLVPEGVAGTWAPVLEKDAAGQVVREAWYFNDHFPWLGMAICAGDWPLVLVYRPVHRAAGLGRAGRADGPPGQHLCRVSEALPRLSVHHSGLDLLRAGEHDNVPDERATKIVQADKTAARAKGGQQRRLPADGQRPASGGIAGDRGGGPALGPDGVAGRRVQRLLDALHSRPLSEVATQRQPAPDRPHGPHRHGGHGGHRPGVDSRCQRGEQSVRVSAEHPGLSGPADLRGVFPGRVLQTAQRQGLLMGHDRRFCAGPVPHAGRHAHDAGHREFPAFVQELRSRQVLLGREQHLLPVFQHLDYDRFRGCDGGGELHDRSAVAAQIQSLTFGTSTAEDKRKTRASWDWREVAASAFVLAAIVGAYLYFRG